jgi:NADH-quinone oxidoreductase subunit L
MTVPLWVVPALPLAGFLLCLLLGRRLGKSFASAVGAGSVGLATVAAWSRLVPYLTGDGGTIVEKVAPWIAAGNFAVDISLRLDPLSALMVSFVTFVGFLIHVYSIGYMKHDETGAGYAR